MDGSQHHQVEVYLEQDAGLQVDHLLLVEGEERQLLSNGSKVGDAFIDLIVLARQDQA